MVNQDPAISAAEAAAFLTCARVVWERGGSLQDRAEMIVDIIWEASGLLEFVFQDGQGWVVRICPPFEGDGASKGIEIPQFSGLVVSDYLFEKDRAAQAAYFV